MESLTLSPRKLTREEVLAGVGCSVLAHVLIFTVAIVGPWAMPRKSFQTPFLSVNLVSMQDIGTGAAAAPKGGGEKSPAASRNQDADKSFSSARAKSAPVVPIKRLHLDEPVTRTETELKKLNAPEVPKVAESTQSTASVEKSLDKLIAKPKTPAKPTPIVQSSRDDGDRHGSSQDSPAKGAQSSATDEQKGDKGVAGSRDGSTKGTADGSSKGNAAGSAGGSPDGAQVAYARRAYYTELWNAIRRHWALPEFLKSQQLEAVLVLVVRKDGKVLDIQFEKQSGQTLFDESVLRAVRKAEPLPPFPEIYSPPKEEIGLRFRPEDLS